MWKVGNKKTIAGNSNNLNLKSHWEESIAEVNFYLGSINPLVFIQCMSLSVTIWVIYLVAKWLFIFTHLHGTLKRVGDIPFVFPASAAKQVLHKHYVEYLVKTVSGLPPPMELFQDVLGAAWKAESCTRAVFMPECPELNLNKSKPPTDYPSKHISWEDLSGTSFFRKESHKVWEMVQWGGGLLGKPEFGSKHPWKSQMWPHTSVTPVLSGAETGGSLRLPGHQPSSEFSERACLAGIRQNDRAGCLPSSPIIWFLGWWF